jgi:conjugative relaxase-like TrwC/TraI family protein
MTASLKSMGCGAAAASYLKNAQDQNQRHRRDDYYIRDREQLGVWYSAASSLVQDRAAIDLHTWQDLCEGQHPRDGSDLVRGAGHGHRAGTDLTFSAPKSLGILWMAGNQEQRVSLETIMIESSREAIGVVFREKLLQIRTGAQGFESQPAQDAIVGQFLHFTSREGDPALHVHNAILNLGLRDDGKWGCTETSRLFDFKLAIGAAFRAALAERLFRQGFRIREAGRDQFEIAGVEQTLIDVFSKRSAQIIEKLGGDRDRASAAQKQKATLETRRNKELTQSNADLESRWKVELAGVDPWKSASGAICEHQLDVAQVVEQFPTLPALRGDDPVSVAASRLMANENVINRRDLLQASFVEAAAQGLGIDHVYECLDELLATNKLLQIGFDFSGDATFTTMKIATEEASLLRNVVRTGEKTWISPAAVEKALFENDLLSDEQRQLVRAMSGSDGVHLANAAAGTGKTTAAKSIVRAAEIDGLTVIGLAPSWIAADELSKSVGITAGSIAKWRHDVERGKADPEFCSSFPALSEATVLLVDESGMVSTSDMAFIADEAKRAGAQLILQGDAAQLESVGGGAALRLVTEQLQRCETMTEVRRQKIEWQRSASMTMVTGDSSAGLLAYLRHGKVHFVSGSDAARAAAIKTWTQQRADFGEAIIITRSNADADELNRLARIQLRLEGRLTGSDFSVKTTRREGKKLIVAEQAFAVGDALRFRQNLKEISIRNGSRGKILTIDPDGMSVRLQDGRILTGRWRDFAPQTSRRRGEAVARMTSPPMIEPDYAGSVHSAQGRTVPATTLYVGSGIDARLTYVALTRHRHDAEIVVEADRVDARCHQQLDDAHARVTVQHRQTYLLGEAGRFTAKRNVVDFMPDRAAFVLRGGDALADPKRLRTRMPIEQQAHPLRTQPALYQFIPTWGIEAVVRPIRSLRVGLIARATQKLRIAAGRLASKLIMPLRHVRQLERAADSLRREPPLSAAQNLEFQLRRETPRYRSEYGPTW